MKHFVKIAILIACLASSLSLEGQELTPVVTNYNKKDHGQGNEIWSVSCTERGEVVFGNEKGLIAFDGINWRTTPLPGGKAARTVYALKDRVYVGSFEEFGYISQGNTGEVEYTSLSQELSEFRWTNDEIWTILEYSGKIIFHSFRSLFIYDPSTNTVSGRDITEFVENIGIGGDGHIYTSAYGLSRLDPESGVITPLSHTFKSRMVGVLPSAGGSTIIATLSDGLFRLDARSGRIQKFHTGADAQLERCVVNRTFVSDQGLIVIGSALDGAFAFKQDGSLAWHIDAGNVLGSNTVHGIDQDMEGNIWLALDAGMAQVRSESGIRYISSISPRVGAVYCTYYEAPYLYLGTNQGLYVGTYDEKTRRIDSIHQIAEFKGNVWYISNFDGQIICGTNGPSYTLGGGRVKAGPYGEDGGSCIAEGNIYGKEVLIQGSYTKLGVFLKKGGKWTYSQNIDGFLEPVSEVDVDFMGNIWAAHMREGLYRITLSEDLASIASIELFPSLSNEKASSLIHVSKIRGRTVFSDGDMFYTYDDVSGNIIPYDALNRTLGIFRRSTKVCPCGGEMYWFITSDAAALVKFSGPDKIGIIRSIPFSLFSSSSVDKAGGPAPGPNGNYIISLNNSVAFIPTDFTPVQRSWRPNLSLLQATITNPEKEESISFIPQGYGQWNYSYRIVRLDFSYPRLSGTGDTYFEYQLEGRDKNWNDIGASTSLNLDYLAEGKYTLHLRARTGAGIILDETSYSFRVKPPFYRTPLAKLFYATLVLFVLLNVFLIMRRRMNDQRKSYENQRLKDEVELKSREIASTTMNALRKNEGLKQIRDELTRQKDELGSSYPDRHYRRMMNIIDEQLSQDEDWHIFENNFDNVHDGFFRKLKERYPDLTPQDLRFCSYLRMNLTSKEIASMMNISMKGVEAARYRIRKKIHLNSKISLTEFLMQLS